MKLKEKEDRIDMTLTLTTKGENKRSFRVWARYKPDGLDRLRVFEPDRKKWVWLYKK